MSRQSLPTAVAETRLIPVLRGLEPMRSVGVVDVLFAAGVRVFEVTMDSPDAGRSIASISDSGRCVGAGTIRSRDDVERALDVGAQFLVAPHTDLELLSWVVDRGVPMIPGVMTPTEAMTAWQAGAAAVKVFPASVVGPSFVKALLGPLPDLGIIPTGGITAADARSYLQAGAVAVGIGGWLTDHEELATIATRAEALVEACRGT